MKNESANPQIIVVGGHTRNIGKTQLIVDIIRAFPDKNWTAVKITQFGHGECSAGPHGCDCAPPDHAFTIDEERDACTGSDSSRFLAAGASRSFWLRTKQGQLALGMPSLRAVLDGSQNAIIESNSVLQFLRPSAYFVVLDPIISDFKDSCRNFLDRADALVLRHPWPAQSMKGTELAISPWRTVSAALFQGKPQFTSPLGKPPSAELTRLLKNRANWGD